MVKIIAEAGVNHEGSQDRLDALLDAAITAKADVFKIQYYQKGLRGKDRELPWLEPFEIKRINRIIKDEDIDFLISPHDDWALRFIYEELGHKIVKIGSGSRHLIPRAKELGFDLIVSLGMTDTEEPMDKLTKGDTILHCVSGYPTEARDAQLHYIKYLKRAHADLGVGYSDHTTGTLVPLAAVAMGATMVEKHLVLEDNITNRQDTLVGLNPYDFEVFVMEAKQVAAAIKPCVRTITQGELETMLWVTDRNAKQTS